MEHMMHMGAPPMTPARWRQITFLWQLAEASSNGSVEGLAWEVSVERNDHDKVIQLVARGAGCMMIVNQGEYHPRVEGAVDSFFFSNSEILEKLASERPSD